MMYKGFEDTWLKGEFGGKTERMHITFWVRRLTGRNRRMAVFDWNKVVRSRKHRRFRGSLKSKFVDYLKSNMSPSVAPSEKKQSLKQEGLPIYDEVLPEMKKRFGFCVVQVNEFNTIITVGDRTGRTIGTVSGGQGGFTGKSRGGDKAIFLPALKLAKKAKRQGVQGVHLFIVNRANSYVTRSFIGGFKAAGMLMISASVVEKTPFGGCRKKGRPSK